MGHYQSSRGGHLLPANYAFDVMVARLDVEADAVDASAGLLSDVELQRASRFAFERDGIDVESVRAVPNADDIAGRFFPASRTRLASHLVRVTGHSDSSIAGRARKPSSRGSDTTFTIRSTASMFPSRRTRRRSSLPPKAHPRDDWGWVLHSFSPGPGLIGTIVLQKFADKLASKVGPERIAVRSLNHRGHK